MSIKFGSIIFILIAMFAAKLSIDNIQAAQAQDQFSSSGKVRLK